MQHIESVLSKCLMYKTCQQRCIHCNHFEKNLPVWERILFMRYISAKNKRTLFSYWISIGMHINILGKESTVKFRFIDRPSDWHQAVVEEGWSPSRVFEKPPLSPFFVFPYYFGVFSYQMCFDSYRKEEVWNKMYV